MTTIDVDVKARARQMLIDHGHYPDLSTRSMGNRPAVVVAASGQHFDIVKHLVATGAEVDPLPAGASPLIGAANGSSVDFIHWLLEHNVEVDVRDTTKKTALHHAVAAGQAPIVRAFVETGASLDVGDKEGKTPLHVAANEGKADIARILLEAGADASTPDASGAAAHAYAASRKEMAELFGELAADGAAAKGFALDAVVDDTEWPELIEAVYFDDPQRVVELLEAGAVPDQTNYRGDSALVVAAKMGNLEVIRALCEAGATLEHCGPSGYGALAVALSKEHPAGLKELLEEFGAKMEMGAIEGQILVMQGHNDIVGAMRRRELVTVAALLDDRKVDIHLLKDATTPLGLASEYGDDELFELLLQKGANPVVPHRGGAAS